MRIFDILDAPQPEPPPMPDLIYSADGKADINVDLSTSWRLTITTK
jgi:hypothetical protein